MKTYRLMLVEQVNGSFEGNDNLREIIEFDADAAGKNIFQLVAELETRIDEESEKAS